MKKFFLIEFFAGIIKDLKTIVWIEKKDLLSLLFVVVLAVFLCSIIILGVDYAFHNLVKILINW
ncbi:MAG: preprotein translocase subunit SecE [Rickettsia sp.]|nr:preprotein translocase subunit SecE [Rickettsia sp.]